MNRLPTACSYLVAIAGLLGLIGCGDSNRDPRADPASDANECSATAAGACCSATDCSGTTPTCDTTTHACRACAGDGDCGSAVCDLDTGSCVAADDIVYASPGGSDTADCTQQAPCTITRAFALASPPRSTIKLEPGAYRASITVTTPTVTVYGAGSTWNPPARIPALTLDIHDPGSEHHLRVIGVSFAQEDASSAISCTGFAMYPATLELDRVSMDVTDTAINFAGCTGSITRSTIRDSGVDSSMSHAVIYAAAPLTIDRSSIEGSYGITAYAPGVVITNSVIAAGREALLASTLGEAGAGTFKVSFSTILTPHLGCGRLQLDNSIVLNPSSSAPADTLEGTCNTVTFTVVFPQTTALGGANNQVGVDPRLEDLAAGNYHLKPGSPAIDAADPAATPAIDLDGTLRPQGAHSDVGAFERAAP